jgi:hypothetical protein
MKCGKVITMKTHYNRKPEHEYGNSETDSDQKHLNMTAQTKMHPKISVRFLKKTGLLVQVMTGG